MKTISTLLTSFLFTSSIFAAGFRPTSILTVKSADRSAIVVIVDDKRFDFGSNSIMIQGLDACEHDVTVYQEAFNGSIYCFGKNYDVLFKSSVLLKPRTSLLIAIDDCGIITMNESRIRTPRFGDTWKGSNFYNDDDYVNTTVYSKAINNYEFNRVLWAINKENMEWNKMRSAEQIISTNYFTVGQVKQLLGLFNLESNKLELAKLAYDKTVDQSDYYAINDVFSYNDSKDELSRCVHSH